MAGFSLSVLRISAFSFPDFSFSTLSFSSIRRDLRPEGRAEPRSEAPRPMRRSFRTRSCFFGWIPRVGTLGWYAMPLQGMGSGTRSAVRYRRHDRGTVSGTRSAAGIGDTIEAPYRERGRRPVSETRSRHRIGNAVGGRYRRHDRGAVSGTRSAVRYRRHNRGAVSGTRSAAAPVDQEARGAARGRAGGGGALMPLDRTMARLSSTLRPRRACWP